MNLENTFENIQNYQSKALNEDIKEDLDQELDLQVKIQNQQQYHSYIEKEL